MTEPPQPRHDSESRFTRRAILGAGLAVATGIGAAGYAGIQYLRDSPAIDSQTYPEPDYGNPDQEFNLTATVGEIKVAPDETVEAWLYDNQYPGPELRVEEGEHVQIQMTNHSPMRHPMHLHGHHFVVDDVLHDTVIVPGHMGQRTLDFIADNPGNWFFHYHHLYHMETGMVRVFEYDETGA